MTPEEYKAERERRGLTQTGLAELMGLARGTINYREAGHPRYPITAEAARAIKALPVKQKKPK